MIYLLISTLTFKVYALNLGCSQYALLKLKHLIVKRMGMKGICLLFVVSFAIIIPSLIKADEVRVAVASNFSVAIKSLKKYFEAMTDHKVILVFGSTGRHYAQIRNGAPFDVFFAADKMRPQKLETEGMTVPDTRITYAVGKVVLWSPIDGLIDSNDSVLGKHEFHHLAIANPKLAPYGRAAKEVLQHYGLWEGMKSKMVRGENISQTYQFIKSGNAELGFVAMSQIKLLGKGNKGSLWEIPEQIYSPIEQQAVLLQDTDAARAFLEFSTTDQARDIIHQFGYTMP